MKTASPNILLITSDQQHWRTLGKNLPEIRTPNLDRLADEGTLFRRAYCPNPTCTPSRASILTGQQPSRHGAWSLGTKLPEDAATVGQLFNQAGYETSLIGKAHFQPLRATPEFPSLESYPLMWDLDFWRNFHGPFYGFSHVELARNHGDESHVGQHYALWMEEKGLTDWPRHFQNRWNEFSRGEQPHPAQTHRWSLPEEFHPNTWIAERTNARLDAAKEAGRPFFLWASFFDPHPPYLVPEPWDTLYDPATIEVPSAAPGELEHATPLLRETQKSDGDFRAWKETPFENHGLHSHVHDRAALAQNIAVYYGMVSLLDKYVGRILDHLDATGQAENTLVVFTSDHGAFGRSQDCKPLRGAKADLYEGGVRVPLIYSLPPRIAPQVRNEPVAGTDFFSTVLDLAGLAAPENVDGRGVAPALLDPAAKLAPAAELCWHFPHYHHLGLAPSGAIRVGRYKLIEWFDRSIGGAQDGPAFELYDLESDPSEQHNLAAQEPARTSELAARLRNWRREVGAQEMTRNPAFDPALGADMAPPPPGDPGNPYSSH